MEKNSCKFSLSNAFWSIEIMCLGDLVKSWFWTNGFTAVPEEGLRAYPISRAPSMGAEVSSAVGFALKIALVLLCQLSFFAKKHSDWRPFVLICFVFFCYKPEFWFNTRFCREGKADAFISLPIEGSSKTLKLGWKSQDTTPDPAAACLPWENICISNKYERPQSLQSCISRLLMYF